MIGIDRAERVFVSGDVQKREKRSQSVHGRRFVETVS